MAILGLRGTGDWGPDERPKNFRETILWRQPNGTAPLFALSAKMGSEKVDDPEFSWWEEENNGLRVELSAAALVGDTTITVKDQTSTGGPSAQSLVAGDILMVNTKIASNFANETLLVKSTTSATQFVVQRAFGGSTAAAIALGATLVKIGSSFPEGSGAPQETTRNPTKCMNLCQIFKTTYGITETAKRTRARTGDPVKNDKKRRMFDHAAALEYAMLFGRRLEFIGSNGKPQRLMGGILWFLSQYASNRIVDGTGATMKKFTDAVYPVFDYETSAGNSRLVLAGNGALNTLNELVEQQPSTNIKYDGIIKLWGMDLQQWVMPQGTLLIKSHPLFNTDPARQNDMLVLDPSVLRYRHMRDTTFKDNIQANDEDSQRGQWLTEAGLEVQHAKTMCWLSNFVK